VKTLSEFLVSIAIFVITVAILDCLFPGVKYLGWIVAIAQLSEQFTMFVNYSIKE